jgi:hypothetical protein
MGDLVLKGLEMALNEVFMILHIIDILYHTLIDANWGIGVVICIYTEKNSNNTSEINEILK